MFNETSKRGGRPTHPINRGRLALAALTAAAAVTATGLAGCSALDGDTVVVNVGYQSKTINTINAGTLMRDQETFEKALKAEGDKNGTKYRVVWQDFSSGAPLTAAMIASHIDIGSMGDYPLLTNGSKTSKFKDAATEFVATTGYNLRGSLNQVVVPVGSSATTLEDLEGKQVSTSLGSAADGMLSRALKSTSIGIDGVNIVNQDPSIGASAIEGKQVDGYAQFVPWPQLIVFRGQGQLLFDGGDNKIPTFHGVVARKEFTGNHPEVMRAFMKAMKTTTDYITGNPLEAAIRASEITGIEPEVIYLYNGPNGLVTFDQTIKPQFSDSLAKVKTFLVDRGSVKPDFAISRFRNDSYLRELFGTEFEKRTANTTNPNMMPTGTDELCAMRVDDQRTASEVWFEGESSTKVSATPSCLLRRIAAARTPVRAGYVPDHVTATKLFAEHATWVLEPTAAPSQRFRPFATRDAATTYLHDKPGAQLITYQDAITASTSTD